MNTASFPVVAGSAGRGDDRRVDLNERGRRGRVALWNDARPRAWHRGGAADGRIWNGLRGLRKDNTGYDLKQLFIGAEGTLGIVTAATLKLFPKPAVKETAWAVVESPAKAVELLQIAKAVSGGAVTGFEIVPKLGLELVLKHIPDTRDPLPTTAHGGF